MRKIPCLFVRDFSDRSRPRLVEPHAVTPGCEWVLAGEGVPTRKRDGTAVMVRVGKLYKRYDCKRGKTPPAGFEPCQEPDAVTGHHPGWVPVGDGPEDRWLREAKANSDGYLLPVEDGTYEACGPRINGNAEGLEIHHLMRHGGEAVELPARTAEAIRHFLEEHPMEGLVFHRGDGEMCKIRRADFGLPWGSR